MKIYNNNAEKKNMVLKSLNGDWIYVLKNKISKSF